MVRGRWNTNLLARALVVTSPALLAGCMSTPLIESCATDPNVPCVDSMAPSAGSAAEQRAWITRYSAEPWAQECMQRKTPDACLRPRYGLALSGGGSRAAPFAMGAIKRLIEDGSWESIDVVSSVSGGGYAAYYTYHKAVMTASEKTTVRSRPIALEDWFVDSRLECDRWESSGCMPPVHETPDYSPTTSVIREACTKFEDSPAAFQKWVSCYQDILASGPGGEFWNRQGFDWLGYAALAGATFVSLPAHHFANTVFDWGMPLSPSQYAYGDGILRAYGYAPPVGGGKPMEVPATSGRALAEQIRRLTFQDLQSLYARRADARLPRMPYWVVQTTNAISTSTFDVDLSPYELDEAVFELGARGFGSGAYGFVSGHSPELVAPDLDVADGVLASAAFLDPIQRELNRTATFTVLHGLNMRWGIRIPNYNVSAAQRRLRATIPFPFYYAHSFDASVRNPYIRLADGGQSGDNIGLISLLRRGTKNILVADASLDAQEPDQRARLAELCFVDSYLRSKHGVKIVFQGHPEGPAQETDGSFELEGRCADAVRQNQAGIDQHCRANPSGDCRLDPYAWRRRVWVARIEPVEVKTQLGRALADERDPTLIYYVKAAIDYDAVMGRARKYDARSNIRCAGTDGDDHLPCGLLRFMRSTETIRSSPKHLGRRDFPMSSTISLTADSNQDHYNAYRDLGWYLFGALCRDTELSRQDLCSAKRSDR